MFSNDYLPPYSQTVQIQNLAATGWHNAPPMLEPPVSV